MFKPLSRWLLVVTCCTALVGQDVDLKQPTDVPDDIGLGERLALIDWLQARKVAIADPGDVPALRLSYLRLAHPERFAKAAEDPAEPLRLELWRRHQVNAEPGERIEALRARLADLDAKAAAATKAADAKAAEIQRRETASAEAERRRATGPRPGAAGQSPASPAGRVALLGDGPDYRPLGDGEIAATYRFLRRISVEIFAASPQASQPWAAEAIALLEDVAISGSHGMASQSINNSKGKSLIAAGCDDPVVLHALSSGPPLELERKALKRIAGSPYPAFYTYRCAWAYAQWIDPDGRHPDVAEFQRALGIMIDAARAMMREKTADPIQRQYVARLLNANIKEAGTRLTPFREAVRRELATATIDPWLWHVLLGYLAVADGWKERGGGYASKVTQQGWKGFNDHLAIAQEHFQEAWRLEPTLALPAIEMINVVMGQGGSVAQKVAWFDKATAVSPECPDAYAYLFTALSPQWGGTPEDILAIGRRALETRAFSTEVPNYYLTALDTARSLSRAPGASASSPDLYADPKVWAEIQTVFDGYLAEPAFAGVRIWNLHRYASMALVCDKREDFLRIASQIGDRLDRDFFRGWTEALRQLDEMRAAGADKPKKP